jgi:hypothetical protein
LLASWGRTIEPGFPIDFFVPFLLASALGKSFLLGLQAGAIFTMNRQDSTDFLYGKNIFLTSFMANPFGGCFIRI